MYKKTIVNNGVRIVTNRMAAMQSAALGIWIKTGGRYESDADKGISHYLEHLLFKGSKRYSCRKIKESIEGVGGSLNGFTSEELTCFLAKLPGRHLYTALDILADMVLNPLLSPREIDKDRTVILEEIKMYKDLPQSYVYELLDELLWPKQPLGSSVLGTAETVRAIDKHSISAYQQKHYTPLNIVVSAAGAVTHAELVKRVEKIFSGLEAGGKNTFLEVKETQSAPQLNILHKETEQTHLALGFHAFKRDHPLKHALGLLHVVLGANMSSRLFNELREKRGLAYEIGTAVKRFHDTGAFVVHAGIDNRRVQEGLHLILKELTRTAHALVGENELRRAKDFYVGQLSLALEDTLDNMLWIGESTAALDKAYSRETIVKEVRRLKRQDLREAASMIFKEQNLNLSLIGPLRGNRKELFNQLHIR